MDKTGAIAICLFAAFLTGCGKRPATAPSAVTPAVADVTITFDGPRDACDIHTVGHAEAHSMPCIDVVSYVTRTLELPNGSRFDYNTIPDVNVTEFDLVMSHLKSAGYELTPGAHVGFLTEPKATHP